MAYRDVVLAALPALYWRLDETSGTNVADSSGNGRVGTYTNSPTLNATTLLPNDYDASAAFPQATGAYAIANAVLNTNLASVEVLWDYNGVPPGAASLDHICGFADGAGGSTYDKNILLDESGHVRFHVYDGAPQDVISTHAVASGTHHLVATYDGTNIRIYVDGVLDCTPVAAASTFTGYTVGNVLVSGTTTEYLHRPERRDEFAVYTYALSDAAVQAHYNAGLVPTLGKSVTERLGRGAGW